MQITTSILVSYAYGLLAPNISQQVKEALLADEALRWQYEGILQLMKDYPDDDPEELVQKMTETVSHKIKSVSKKSELKEPVSLRSWLLMAAVFIIVVGIGIFFACQNSESATTLAEQIIKDKTANPFENATRGSLQDRDTTKWKTAFTKNEFPSVIFILEQKENKSMEEQFFLALSYLKLSSPQPEKAKPIFSKLTVQESSFSNDAWLYLALAQTLLTENKEAIGSLQHVEQTAQVKELEERLRK